MPAKSEAAKRHNDELHRESYLWYKDGGICPRCKKAWAAPGKVYCETCTRKRKYSMDKRDPGRTKRRAYDAERKAKLIELGICVDCAKRPAVAGRRKCAQCQAKQNESNKAYRVRQKIIRETDRTREGK